MNIDVCAMWSLAQAYLHAPHNLLYKHKGYEVAGLCAMQDRFGKDSCTDSSHSSAHSPGHSHRAVCLRYAMML